MWHTGQPIGNEPLAGVQLWVALPPELENAPAQRTCLSPEQILQSGPVKVLLGEYGGQANPVRPPSPIHYLGATLQDGEAWSYQPPADHDVAWVAVARGKLHTSETVAGGELAVFAEGNTAIRFRAAGETVFVLGSAIIRYISSARARKPRLPAGHRLTRAAE